MGSGKKMRSKVTLVRPSRNLSGSSSIFSMHLAQASFPSLHARIAFGARISYLPSQCTALMHSGMLEKSTSLSSEACYEANYHRTARR